MKIYTLDDILKTEHTGEERYVKYKEIVRLEDLLERALPYLNGVSDAFRNEIKQALKEE